MKKDARKSTRNDERLVQPNNESWLPVTDLDQSKNGIKDAYWTGTQTNNHDVLDEGVELKQPVTIARPTQLQKWRFKAELKLQTLVDWFTREVETEVELGLGFLLIPVFFGVGCIIYFNLPREPLIGAFLSAAVVCGFVAYKVAAAGPMRTILASVCIVATGVTVAQFQTHWRGTKALPTTVFADVSGVVENVEHRSNGSFRYTLDTSKGRGSVKARAKHYDVDMVRLTARKGTPAFKLNETIIGRARVGPASGPAYPGGYDFGFQNWFNGIGGSGFFLGAPKKAAMQVPTSQSFGSVTAKIRHRVGSLIRSSLPGDSGGLASALIVGDRSGISESVAEDLRKSGLAHILAISGLHMALISATVIVGLRIACSFAPSISLHRPVKKWASCAALLVSAIYLILSGAGVSTQRAFIMISIMLLAVMLDRRALTMRNVAIAALVVLILAPHAVLSPGFQMSFSAVAALIATYEVLKRRREVKQSKYDGFASGRVRKWMVRDIGGLALTSVIAGAATGLFAAYHFQRVAGLGLLANVLAMPFVSLMVMPLALLSVVAMPFGLEAYPLHWMAAAIGPVTSIANWVSELGYVGNTGLITSSSLIVGSMALVILTLFQSRLRLMSLGLLPIAVTLTTNAPEPHILILENAQQIAVQNQKGELQILRPNAEKFNTEIWLRAYAPHRLSQEGKPRQPTYNPYFTCDDYGCTTQVQGKTLTWLKSTAQLQRDCRQSDILVIPFAVENACTSIASDDRPIVIDTKQLQQHGSHAIYIDSENSSQSNTVKIATAFTQLDRPWMKRKAQ
jgi:competence protein ComEC